MNDQAEAVEVEVVPVETEVVEASAPELAETSDSVIEAEADEKETQVVEKTYSQKEFDDATTKARKKAESVAERRALKAYAGKLEAMQQKPVGQETQAKVNDGMPDIATYGEDVNKYVKDMVQWELGKEREEMTRQERAYEDKVRNAKANELYGEAEKLPGFDADIFESILTPAIANAILNGGDIAPKLMAYLSENPKDAERIANLVPARQAAEIGKLEVKLSEAKTVTASKAPAPMKPVGSKGGQVHKPVAEMTLAELRKFEETRGSKFI